MAKYVFPAIFTPEEDGGYSVRFPDVEGCLTCGDDLAEALIMASDALALMLYSMEAEKKDVPSSSDINDWQLAGLEEAHLVACDTLAYARMYAKQAVKKTLSIPQWLNELSTRADINFSQVLQDALKKKLGIEDAIE